MLVYDSAQTKNAPFFFNERRLVCPIGGVYIIMKRKTKTLLSIALIAIMLFCTTGIAHAAGPYTLTSTYQDIWVATGNTGINSHIWVRVYNTSSLHHTDIRMLDANGNTVWEEFGAIDYSSSRQFWCGSNVYRLQARVGAVNILGDSPFKTAQCDVWK